mgnify:CR=1 FL=1
MFSTQNQPRGLHNFIAEIRNCNSKDEERMRVDKELANIRSKFAASGLSSYQKKKYVWKMCYIYMLGTNSPSTRPELLCASLSAALYSFLPLLYTYKYHLIYHPYCPACPQL